MHFYRYKCCKWNNLSLCGGCRQFQRFNLFKYRDSYNWNSACSNRFNCHSDCRKESQFKLDYSDHFKQQRYQFSNSTLCRHNRNLHCHELKLGNGFNHNCKQCFNLPRFRLNRRNKLSLPNQSRQRSRKFCLYANRFNGYSIALITCKTSV
jgi:hypothetical protein